MVFCAYRASLFCLACVYLVAEHLTPVTAYWIWNKDGDPVSLPTEVCEYRHLTYEVYDHLFCCHHPRSNSFHDFTQCSTPTALVISLLVISSSTPNMIPLLNFDGSLTSLFFFLLLLRFGEFHRASCQILDLHQPLPFFFVSTNNS